MISFRCPHCEQKLNVKDHYAGRQAKCPACKRPLVVPPPSQTAPVAAGAIGTPSSLGRAGIEGGVTLDPGASAARGNQKPVREILARHTKSGERYVVEGEIARGGMGAVLRAVDCDIHREVAVKYLLDPDDPKKKLRFVEEAQITGQLEHPNIVPIHEMGVDGQQRLFFAMKMVKGRSLAQVLDDLREQPKPAEKEWPLSRLLTIFVNVCHALAYAHARGVIHRDLKPANIMVGDFGEVYVMDWGLAKVLRQELASGVALAPRGESPTQGGTPRGANATPLANAVKTSREGEADLTQDGAILGTPAYMPPEQAGGDLQAVDRRSDVYSLGAILYEMLTLEPPVERDGGYLVVLLRVMQGDILPPERRTPQRSGKMPRELTAIAMKAMAKQPSDRYAAVEALRRDIDRFLEGRSVSAKPDSVREMAWKLVKRNKAASAAAVLLVLVLVGGLGILASAWAETRSAYDAYRKEQGEKEARTRKSVPAFVQAARLAAQKKKLDEALEQVNVALEYDPEHAEAHLLKAKLLIVKQEFAAADEPMQRYLRLRPDDPQSSQLSALCRRVRADDPPTLYPILVLFAQTEDRALGRGMEDFRQKILAHYSGRIDKAWPGMGKNLKMDAAAKLDLNLEAAALRVTTLRPLKDLPLTRLSLNRCSRFVSLKSLEGMPLTNLDLWDCQGVRDLTPLKDMQLTHLALAGTQVQDLTPLSNMRLTRLDLGGCEVKSLAPLRGMPLTWLSLNACRQIVDFAPLHGLPLNHLDLMYTQIQSLKPLEGMALTWLNVGGCKRVTNLAPLKGMNLTYLIVGTTGVADLGPLEDMPLTSLFVDHTEVKNLTPLAGMNLQYICFSPRNITTGMQLLREMKSLKTLSPDDVHVQWTPEQFWKRYDAGEFKK